MQQTGTVNSREHRSVSTACDTGSLPSAVPVLAAPALVPATHTLLAVGGVNQQVRRFLIGINFKTKLVEV